MGTLADPALRRKRHDAHLMFDRLWKEGYMTIDEAYRWLQTQLGLPESEAHIGKFSDYRCNEVIRMCEQFLSGAGIA